MKLLFNRKFPETEAEDVRFLFERQEAQILSLQLQLKQQEMRGELSKLRALEDLEHGRVLEREADMRANDQERIDAWIQDVKKSHQVEKEHLQQQITILEKAAISRRKVSPRKRELAKVTHVHSGRVDITDSETSDSAGDQNMVIPVFSAAQATTLSTHALPLSDSDVVPTSSPTDFPNTQGMLFPLVSAPLASSTSTARMVSSSGGTPHSSLNPFENGTIARE